MARKGQFKKGGGRVGGGATPARSRKRASSTAIVVVPRALPAHKRRSTSVAHHQKAHHPKRRRHHGHGGITLGKIFLTTIGLSSACGTNSGPLGAKAYDLIQKVPGAKTFGGAATAGLLAGGIYKFTKFGGRGRPWLAAAGIVGVVLAAAKLGEQGTAFKWLGDAGGGVMDVED